MTVSVARRLLEAVARDVVDVSPEELPDPSAAMALERTGLIVAAGLRLAAAEIEAEEPATAARLLVLAAEVEAEAGRFGAS